MANLVRTSLILLVVLAMAQPVRADYNGADSYMPANTTDRPIFRQFAFVDGKVTQYHVLKPNVFVIDDHQSYIYQFPECTNLAPVLQRHALDHDAPTRQVVDVVLGSGCVYQPRSAYEVADLALHAIARPMWVNAPKIPAPLANVADDMLFNAPPYRPRVAAWEEGVQVKFITYEASWMPTWVGTRFPAQDADVFIVSYGPIFKAGWSILNTAVGTPLDPNTLQRYSPIWRANCVVDADVPVCGSSVNLSQPYDAASGNGYYQCKSTAACLTMRNLQGHDVQLISPPDFSHIDCPMVAVDLSGDDFIDPPEELAFPDLWVDGPVTVV